MATKVLDSWALIAFFEDEPAAEAVEKILEQATAEKEITAGKYRGPLHGIPWGAKDAFATKGILTTWGTAPYRNQVFDYDAAVVTRLQEAGAVLIGKLAMVELVFRVET